MTSREVIELKKDIMRFLAKRQIKDAFEALFRLTVNTNDWHIREQVNELETNYKYMLHYLFEGVKDPEREKMYRNLLRSLYEITDDASDELLRIESSNLFYERQRLNELKSDTLKDYHNELKEVSISISLCDLMGSGEEQQVKKREFSIKRERIAIEMFNSIFASYRTNAKNITDYYNFIDSIDIPSREKSLFISALSLNLFHRFDALKIQVLLRAIQSDIMIVRARAIVGLVVVMQMYDIRWQLYPELQAELDALGEDPKFRKAILRVVIQLIRSRETEKISKRLTEEIIPEMIRFNNKAGKNFNMDELMNESDFSDKNPEWQKELEESGLSKKLQEYSNLQMEGADVFHSTFSSLKNYPFFRDLGNWFLPFDPTYSEVTPLFTTDSKNNILHAAIVDSGHMCNSDKYSFCLSLLQISASQREMMMGKLNAESDEIKQMQKDASGTNPTIEEEVISNQYIQDLYRFFKLNPYKSSFFDIFKLSINFHEKRSISPLISDIESLRKIGLYCFDKNNFAEALDIFTHLVDTSDADTNLWQKIAYCKQMLHDLNGALEAYLKADLINPNNSWVLKHIAQLYRTLKQPKEAIVFYQKAAKLTPDNLSLELNIGHCYLELDDYSNALNSYFKVEMLDNKSDRALRPIAWASFLDRKYEQARRYYQRILGLKPTIHDYLNAGHVELCDTNYKLAINLYKSAALSEDENQFVNLFEEDKETLFKKGVNKQIIPFLLDQIKYSVS